MTKPRYTVGSVSGYRIGRDGHTANTQPSTLWYVYDRFYGYRIVKEFKNNRVSAESKARALADKLNAPPVLPKPRTHCKRGHLLALHNRYVTPRGYVECKACRYDANVRRQERIRGA